ncbi:MAG TPA: hypothetical protein VEC99_03040 [Clostridia bacterium]|nr:hypothetical protein [Clostridia bacterium]
MPKVGVIKYQTFAAWVARRRQQRGLPAPVPSKKADPVRRLEAMVQRGGCRASPKGSVPVKVGLSSGGWVEFSQTNQVSLVVADSRVGQALEPMLSFSGSLKVFVALETCDKRHHSE